MIFKILSLCGLYLGCSRIESSSTLEIFIDPSDLSQMQIDIGIKRATTVKIKDYQKEYAAEFRYTGQASVRSAKKSFRFRF